MKTTLKDIAENSRCLERYSFKMCFISKRKVTEETRDRILEISNELNYFIQIKLHPALPQGKTAFTWHTNTDHNIQSSRNTYSKLLEKSLGNYCPYCIFGRSCI